MIRRDTVLIPAYSWMILRFVTDNPGMWAFHCRMCPSTYLTRDPHTNVHCVFRFVVAHGRGPAHADQQSSDDGSAAAHTSGYHQSVSGVEGYGEHEGMGVETIAALVC